MPRRRGYLQRRDLDAHMTEVLWDNERVSDVAVSAAGIFFAASVPPGAARPRPTTWSA